MLAYSFERQSWGVRGIVRVSSTPKRVHLHKAEPRFEFPSTRGTLIVDLQGS